MVEMKLPKGLNLGSPITSNGQLLGHVTEGGTLATLLIEGEEYHVPMVMDGEYVQELISRQLPEDVEIPIQIGGKYGTNVQLKKRDDIDKYRVRPNPNGLVLDQMDREHLRRNDPVYDNIVAAREHAADRQASLDREIASAQARTRQKVETSQEAEFDSLMSAFRRDTYRKDAGLCDFCDSDEVMWDYPCEPFEMASPGLRTYHSDGAWLVCDLCAQAVERNDRMTLANRALKTKPPSFHDELQPWTLRLHNQFFRHRVGNRQRRPDYAAASDRTRGSIEVISADNTEAARALGASEVAAYVKATGEPAMVMINDDGTSQIVAEGQQAVEASIERRQIVNLYSQHPLMSRYFQHIGAMQSREGIWRNFEPWHALAEKYVVTFAAAHTLGIHGKENDIGSYHFDPRVSERWPTTDPAFDTRVGLHFTRAVHDSVPYLWMSKVDELAEEPTLPAHRVTRDLVPHPAMFWSFESAIGPSHARMDWMLIVEANLGYEIWCPVADDDHQTGRVMITGMNVRYGAKWPDDFIVNGHGDGLAEFFLKHLSFLNSKYVEAPHVRAHRNVRRDVERTMKKQHQPMPDDLGAFVVHLRAPEPKPARPDSDGDARDFKRQHCWWRRAHTRILYRDTKKERATWVQATLMGDTSLPLIRKTYVVDR